jgi:Delta3-Delta2-enoyl-CoA isomerase
MASLDRQGDVFVLHLGDDENRIGPKFIETVLGHLDAVANAPAPRALVTNASGKFFSFGLDVEWMRANREQVPEHLANLHELLARFVELPVPTVAAIQGHAFAGGALLALAHDHIVMRADRGYFCLPEIDIQVPFSPGLMSLITSAMPARTAREVVLTGRRYGGHEALAAGIVDEAVPEDAVFPAALSWAEATAAKEPRTFAAMKRGLYAETLAALRDADANRAEVDRFDPAFAILLG